MGRICLFSSRFTVIKMLLVIAFLLASVVSRADETLISDLNKIVINNYSAINAFYNFGVNIGDKGLEEDIRRAFASSKKTFSTINSETTKGEATEDYNADIQKLESEYSALRKLVATNMQYVKKRGYPDLRLSDDLARKNTEFTKLVAMLEQKIKTTSDFTLNQQAESCRQIQLALARLVTKYSARSTSNVSQVFQGSETDQPVKDTVAIVDHQLATLLNNGTVGDEVKKLLKSAEIKWKFIRGSYLNYNEDTANYIVNFNTKKMIQKLTEAESLILGTSSS